MSRYEEPPDSRHVYDPARSVGQASGPSDERGDNELAGYSPQMLLEGKSQQSLFSCMAGEHSPGLGDERGFHSVYNPPPGLGLSSSWSPEDSAVDETDHDPPPGLPSPKDIADLMGEDEPMTPSGLLVPWMRDLRPDVPAEPSQTPPGLLLPVRQPHGPLSTPPPLDSPYGSSHSSQLATPMKLQGKSAAEKLSLTAPVSPPAGGRGSACQRGCDAAAQFCVYCGMQVEPKYLTAKFCGYCGSERVFNLGHVEAAPRSVDASAGAAAQTVQPAWPAYDCSDLGENMSSWSTTDDSILSCSDKDMWQSPSNAYGMHAGFDDGSGWYGSWDHCAADTSMAYMMSPEAVAW